MTDNVQTAMFDILKKIQNDIAAQNKRFDTLESELADVKSILRKQRRDLAGLMVIGKAMAGDFTEQVSAIEARVIVLEARKS